MNKAEFVFLCLFTICTLTSAQSVITGKVVDVADGEPLFGVTVYISGSSRGTTSNLDGTFSIKYPDETIAPLVLSFVGYETYQIENPTQADLSLVQMKVKSEELEEVVLELDPWSREKKEHYFKKFFLGSVPAAKLCEIKNLNKVRLRFNPSYQTLYAVSDEPIRVDNKLLGYTVSVDLADFEVSFAAVNMDEGTNVMGNSSIEKVYRAQSSYMLLTTYFKEMSSKRPKAKKRLRNRKRLYNVSIEHFFKHLIAEDLKESGYHLTYDSQPVEFSDHIRVKKFEDGYVVEFRNNEYEIVDSKGGQSLIILNNQKVAFTTNAKLIDGKAMLFGGFLGRLKLSGMLPLDYDPEKVD